MQQSGRIGWIEYARALGAVGVVLIHMFASTAYACDLSTTRLVAYSTIGIVLGRWAVPGFFMITGYLLLDPQKDVGWSQARRYSWRMALVIITFGFLFALMEAAFRSLEEGGLTPLVVPRALVNVLTASSWEHLWYVYALMFVYLLVPPVRWLQKKAGTRGLVTLSAVLFVFVLVVPTALWLQQIHAGEFPETTQRGLVALATNVAIGATYLCLGGCLRSVRHRAASVVMACGMAALVAMLAISVMGVVREGDDYGVVFMHGSCFACLYAMAVLVLIKRWKGDEPLREGTLICVLARDSFGIYVIHPLFVHVALMAVDPTGLPPVLFEVLFTAALLVLSVGATRLVRRIPAIGKLL